jgi:uncharacterized protein (TIGR03085 family)
MTEPLDQVERRELCDLFLRLGPDAPTLCKGWTTLDLAAHLALREHFTRWGDERLTAEKAKGMPDLVQQLRHGAPLIPWRVPGLRTMLNGVEYFIHHEDVRRANGMDRRPSRSDLEKLSWRMLRFLGRRPATKLKPTAIHLIADDGRRHSFGSGDGVTLTGPPSELLLYLSGRRTAVVDVQGAPDAVVALEDAVTGL